MRETDSTITGNDLRSASVGRTDELSAWLSSRRRLVALTGAGCSTESGIPDYRGPQGSWNRRKPMTIGEFLRSPENRQHYWARSSRGWPRFAAAQPNSTHKALAAMEHDHRLSFLITQNVDGLHQKAGSSEVLDLHGRNDRVICLECRQLSDRQALQNRLYELNRNWFERSSEIPLTQLADGDSELTRDDTLDFRCADCIACGGLLKPDVVFFGESVPAPVVATAMNHVENSDGLLVIGSSLTVWSGYRFALAASKLAIPIAIINVGDSRADDLAGIRVNRECGAVLAELNL